MSTAVTTYKPPAEVTEMTAEKLRELFKRQVAEAAVDIFPSFIQELRNSEDPDQMRKFLAMAAEVNGWKDPPPKNAMDNLPVFNFNFSGTGVTVETTMPDGSTQSIEVTQNAQPAKPAEQLDVIEIVTPAGVPGGTPPAQPGMLKLDGEMFDLDSLLADD